MSSDEPRIMLFVFSFKQPPLRKKMSANGKKSILLLLFFLASLLLQKRPLTHETWRKAPMCVCTIIWQVVAV